MTLSHGPSTFERIQNAALESFAEHGFEATGIRQVAERAGIPTSLLYHYSRSKSQLLRILVEGGLQRLVEADRAAVRLVRGASRRLAALVAVHVFVHAENPQMARLLDTELRVLHGEDRAAVLTLRDRVDSTWAEVLAAGQAEGVLHVEDIAVTRLALIRMCNGVATWYSPAGRLDVVTLAGRFAELALRACGATPVDDVDLVAIQQLVKDTHEGMPGGSPGQAAAPHSGADRRRA